MAGRTHEQALSLSLLPTEIRLRIYGEVLQFGHAVTKRLVKPRNEDDALPPVNRHFGLLFVNK